MNFHNWLSGVRPEVIEVHHYKVFNPVTKKWVIPPRKCTAERIVAVEGKIIAGTNQSVALVSLDADGCYEPKLSR